MDVDGYLPLVLPVIAALAAHPLAERLPPRTATWVLTALAAGLAGCATLTLAALAEDGPVAAIATRVALAAAVTAAAYATVRQVRALRSMARAARELPGDSTLAVIDDDHVDAYTVPGRVVVSTGMLALLTPAERRVLFAHEFAHLTGRHHLFRAVVRVATAAVPLLWPLRDALAYATERWADERAATAIGDRGAAARTIGKAALARGRGPAGALGIGNTRPGPVPRRVAALLGPPPRRRVGLTAAALSLVLWSAVSADDLPGDLSEHVQSTSRAIGTAAHAPRR